MWRIRAFDRDNHEVSRIEIETGELSVGRDADRELHLPSASVSRRHARLFVENGSLRIVDEGSSNGVIVNGSKISGPVVIDDRSKIEVADFRIEVEIVGGSARTPAAEIPDGPFGAPLRLIADGGPYDRIPYELNAGELIVGRAVENDLVFDDPSLSRRHARLLRRGMSIEVEDLGSSNGTLINSRKITRGVLNVGDVVRFGELYFKLESGSGQTASHRSVASSALWGLIGGVGLTLLVWLIALVGIVRHPPEVQTPPREAIAQIVKMGEQHLRLARTAYMDKRYPEAKADIETALQSEPGSAEARSLRQMIDRGPDDDRQVETQTKVSLPYGDRKGMENALRVLDELTPKSQAQRTLSVRLVSALEKYGQDRCAEKKYGECSWALCRAFEIAPVDARPSVRASHTLDDAEKKLSGVKDHPYTPCRFTPK